MADDFTTEEIRGAILDVIRVQKVPFTQVETLEEQASKVLGIKPTGDPKRTPFHIAIWELIFEGVFVPSHPGGNDGWPHLTVTPYGAVVVASSVPAPHDRDGYIKALPPLSDVALAYLDEAFLAFRGGAYIAAVAMIGAVAEECLDPLVDAVVAWLGPTTKDGKTLDGTASWRVGSRLDGLRAALEAHHRDLDPDLRKGLDKNMRGIADLLRTSRDEAAHPTSRGARRDEVFVLFRLLAGYLHFLRRLTDWVRANTGT